MSNKIFTIAVVGGGSAGVMAAMRSVLNNDETLFFPGAAKHKKKSRAFWVKKVENMPGHLRYDKGIENPNLENLKWLAESDFKEKFHWMKNTGIDCIKKNDDGTFLLTSSKGSEYFASHIILCTGVMDIQPLINGSIEPIFPYANIQDVDYCIRCDGHHAVNKNVTIIGHKEDAAWIAFILHERYRPLSMTILTNGEEINLSEKEKKLCSLYNIEVKTQKILDVKGDENKRLSAYLLEGETLVKTNFTFVSLGMIVYNELALSLGIDVDERGFVLTNGKGLSSLDNFYIAGDLRAGLKKQIYTAWDSAVDAADDINSKSRREQRERLLEL